MPDTIYLVYLDDHHLDDPLYVASMARIMARLRQGVPPCLFVHGGGGHAGRLLEAEGLFPEHAEGRPRVVTAQEAALVERALRQVNRRVVGTLTDEGVHAVGFHGADRGLLRVRDDGMLTAGTTGWLGELIRMRAVPVISSLVHDSRAGGLREGCLPDAALALAQALAGVVVAFFTRSGQPGIRDGTSIVSGLALDAVPAATVPDPEAVRAVSTAGFPVLLTNAGGLFGGERPLGTKIFTSKTAQNA